MRGSVLLSYLGNKLYCEINPSSNLLFCSFKSILTFYRPVIAGDKEKDIRFLFKKKVLTVENKTFFFLKSFKKYRSD